MVGITLSPEQIRAAPPEVRRWLEHELAVPLGLNPPTLPITQPSHPHLAACTPEEAAQVLSLIQGMLPVVHVFFELGREGAAPSEGSRPSGSPTSCVILAWRCRIRCWHAWKFSIRRFSACATIPARPSTRWMSAAIVSSRHRRSAVSGRSGSSLSSSGNSSVPQFREGPVSARFAPGPSPGASSFLTASPSGPAVPLPEMAPSTSSDRLGAASEWRAPSPPTIAPGAPVEAAVDRPHAPSPSGQAEQQGGHDLSPVAAHAGRETGRSARKRKSVAGRKGRLTCRRKWTVPPAASVFRR